MKRKFAIALLMLAMLCTSALAQEETAEDWFNRGQELFRNHSYEEAIEAYDNALALNPQYGMAWGGKATALSLTGRYNESLDAFDEAIETWPANDTERISELWVFKGNTLQLMGRPKEAFEAFDEAIRIYPQNFDAWIWKGEFLQNQGLYNESLNAYSMAVDAAPKEISAAGESAKVAKADVLLKMGRYEEAYDIYNETSDLNSTEDIDKFYLAWSWRGMGSALAGLGRHNESLEAFNKSIEVYPESAFQAWGDEGNALSSMEKYEEAIAAYDRSIELAPSEFASAKAEIGKGQALDKLGRSEEAVNAFENAIENLNKTLQQSAFDAQSWYLKGTALEALGRQAEADAAYAKARELGYRVPAESDAEKSSIPEILAITGIKVAGDDELVEIANSRSAVQSIEGWTLDVSDGKDGGANQSASLPKFALGPDEWMNVHLGEGESNETDIFLKSAVALNDTAGSVTLKDETERDVASFVYRVEPDGSITGIMTAEGEFSYPPSGSSDVKVAVREAGNGTYVAERAEYKPEASCSAISAAAQEDEKDDWYKNAFELYMNGSFQDAISAYDKALEADPQNSTIWQSKAAALRDNGELPEAIEAYGRAAELNPQERGIWNIQGFLLFELGRYDEASEAYDKAILADPESAGAWGGKAEALDNLDRHDEAVRAYERSIEILTNVTKEDSNDSISWAGLGYVLMKVGRYDQALEAYDKAAETASLGPSYLAEYASAKAWAGKGSVLNEMGNYEGAQESFDRALEISPDYSLVLQWKGDALMDQGRYEDALPTYEKAIETDSIFPKLWHKKGIALKELGRNSEAEAAYARAEELGYQG